MKFAHVLVLAVVITLVVSTAASAHVRHGVKVVGEAAVAVVTGDEGLPSDEGSPSPSPSDVSPAPEPSETVLPLTEPTESPDEAVPADEPTNHGEAVSAVAKDKTAVGTKTLKNGKTVTNHGQAVSAVAKSDAGKHKDDGTSDDGDGDPSGD
jgi:hypothetical protein